MNNPELQDRIKSVKSKIEKLIENGQMDEAKEAIDQYEAMLPGDPEVCSMRAVISIIEGSLNQAESVIMGGLEKDSVQFDLLFNLAYIYELQGKYQQAVDFYCKAETVAYEDNQKQNVRDAIDRIKSVHEGVELESKARIVFFVKEGMDSFLGDIIDGLDSEYWVRKIIVSDFGQIDVGMKWADICWFEWCDELVAYGSRNRLAFARKLVCRLHSYEAFTEYIYDVDWENIDKVIFVANHIRDFVLNKQEKLKLEQTVVIPNGINLEKYTFTKGSPSFKIAYVGYINYKKGPMLLLQTFKALYDKDRRFTLHIAGKFQDYRDELYFSQMVKEFGIEDNIFLDGWQDDINKWLEDKNYILCTSLLESQNLSIMQAMCKGIKPVIHNFVGAKSIYPNQYIWNTINEAIDIILSGNYDPDEYHRFISGHFSLEKQGRRIKELIYGLPPYKSILSVVDRLLKGSDVPQEPIVNDITLLIPCYNRALLVKEHFDRGLIFPSIPKLLVDDCSDDNNKKILKSLEEADKYSINIIFREKNGGVAAALDSGVKNVRSKYIIGKGDDDLLVYNKTTEDINDMVSCIGVDFPFVTPRYLINMKESMELDIGYDKKQINNWAASRLLRDLFVTGELRGINAGAIYLREDMLKCMPETIFKVSEDYVITSRVLSRHMDSKVKVAEDISYVRMMTANSLSRTMDDSKLTQHLISMMIPGFYCLKAGLINRHEFMETFILREELLNKLYNYSTGLADTIIDFSRRKIDIYSFIRKLMSLGICIPDISALPYEMLHLPKLMI